MVFIIIIVGIMGWESDIEVIDGWMGTRRLMKLNNDF